ncbi:MAG: hypothetical protein HKN05_09365 [Rhizobiales bacterium]|nr:hypothetical protein [Hyphomicrobiales bacterium]
MHHSDDGDLIEGMKDTLQKLYGDFPTSDLFRRMATAMHALGPELQDSTGKRYIFSYCPRWPELTEAAKRILAELDA